MATGYDDNLVVVFVGSLACAEEACELFQIVGY
jgi:hypothetical protein